VWAGVNLAPPGMCILEAWGRRIRDHDQHHTERRDPR